MIPTAGYRRLIYEPSVEADRLSQSKQQGLTPINPTLARRMVKPGVYELFFHANSKLTATEGGRDVSNQYKLLRLRRQWTGKLNGTATNAIATGYVLETEADGPGGFGEDYGPGSWIDLPGMRITGRSSMSFRSLQEFIVGVGELQKDRSPVPDFGGLYFITAVDILPEKYKVWMSLEKRLTPDQIQGAMGVVGRAFPYGIIPQRAPDFAGWRYVPHDWQDYAKFTR